MRVNFDTTPDALPPFVVFDVNCAACGPPAPTPESPPCPPAACTTDVDTSKSSIADESDWTMVHHVEDKWVKLVRP